MQSSRKQFYFALVIFGLVGQIAWVVENMYLNVFLYQMFHASAADIAAMVSASAVTATLTTMLIGALSDKLGRRKVFICGGYILWGISILGFALLRADLLSAMFPTAASISALGVTLVILLDCLMTFFGSSANDACFNAWLTDVTTSKDRGAVEGINAMMPMVAILAVFGGFMSFDLERMESWTVIFCLIGGVVLGIGVAGFFLIRDPALSTEANQNYFANLVYGFRPGVIRQNFRLYLYLAAFAIFGISIQIFMPYLILYYTVSLQMENYVFVMAPAIVLAAGFTAVWGRVYDKRGLWRAIVPPLGLLCGGYVVLACFRGTPMVFLGSLLMMCGYLASTAVFGAVIRDCTPPNRAGMFQGLRIVAQVLLPGILGPGIGAYVLRNADTVVNGDGTTSFVPNANIFWAALAVALAVSAFLTGVYFLLRRRKEAENEVG
ncbi:MAG: MFS transporter [Clostridia bacterium]|nr:MFS transporter [Clostridia bacterium]